MEKDKAGLAPQRLPSYGELPAAPDGGRSAWAMFGPDDQCGLVNLLSPDRVLAAVRLVNKGAVFSLNAALDAFDPTIARSRGNPRQRVLHEPGAPHFDDVIDNFYPQGSSQWDSLAHVGYGSDQFYNGATEADILSGRRNTIEHWARRGIAGRGVVLDMYRTAEEAGEPYEPGTSTGFGVADLERARKRHGLEFQQGDILVLHTGFAKWYVDQPIERRRAIQDGYTTPGLAQSEEMCRYLWDHHFAAIVTDTFAVEVFPRDESSRVGSLHRILIGQFGMALGELWWTDELAADCANDKAYEALIVSAPLHCVGGIGSPANALALK
jgi:kynurenine formamidase